MLVILLSSLALRLSLLKNDDYQGHLVFSYPSGDRCRSFSVCLGALLLNIMHVLFNSVLFCLTIYN